MSENNIDLMDLLDTELDNIEDLPELVTLPNCTARVRGMSIKGKETSNGNPSFGVTFELIEVVEINPIQHKKFDADPENFPKGSMVYFMMADKDAGKALSRLKAPFAETMRENGMGKLSELADQFDQLEFEIAVTARPDSSDDTRFYGDLKAAVIA